MVSMFTFVSVPTLVLRFVFLAWEKLNEPPSTLVWVLMDGTTQWNYGGFPEWLKREPGIVFRDNNQPFMNEMAAWMATLVDIVRYHRRKERERP